VLLAAVVVRSRLLPDSSSSLPNSPMIAPARRVVRHAGWHRLRIARK
jgi:hypothetical protein